MGLDDEFYLRQRRKERQQQAWPFSFKSEKRQSKASKSFQTCPNCCESITAPLSSGRQICRHCGWKGTPTSVNKAARKKVKPVRDIGFEALARLVAPFKRVRLPKLWVRYVLMLLLFVLAPPMTHYLAQARSGHPLDPHYFIASLDPRNMLGNYNGPGGADWRIGEPLANWSNGYAHRSLSEMRSFALALVNRDRQLNVAGALSEDAALDRAAQKHAEDMLRRKYFAHVSPEGRDPRARMMAEGVDPHIGTGENIYRVLNDRTQAMDYNSTEQAQKGWMYSDGHRRNLLTGDYCRFGYGTAIDVANGSAYWVQVFATCSS
jgi:uncharacterized protein YkwD